jgi:hypothetical protein
VFHTDPKAPASNAEMSTHGLSVFLTSNPIRSKHPKAVSLWKQILMFELCVNEREAHTA